jgi:hypothetical protein
MSSDGNNDLAHEYTAGAVADSPVPFSQTNPINTSVNVPVPIIDFTTLQSLDPAATVFSPRPVTASSSASDYALSRNLRYSGAWWYLAWTLLLLRFYWLLLLQSVSLS